MDFASYKEFFHAILTSPVKVEPYDNPEYLNYATLNWFRQRRWLEKGKLDKELLELIGRIDGPMKWIFITEPWCGDAAHILPFIVRLIAENPNIILDIQRRDSAPFLIDDYLSGHSRSIPKLIVRDNTDRDVVIWGSRPLECQRLFDELGEEGVDHEEIEIRLQRW